MTVPALTTDNIGAFAWWRQDGCYSVELSDVLDYIVYYEQQPEYVDTILFLGQYYGPINIRIRSDGYILAWYSKEWSDVTQTIDTISASVTSTITCDPLSVEYYYGSNSLITSNELAGSVIEMLSGTYSGYQFHVRSSSGNSIVVNTTDRGYTGTYFTLSVGDTFKIISSRAGLVYSSTGTSLAYAIKLIWDQLRGNQIGGSGDALTDYTEINNYDYEYTNATSMHVFGYTGITSHSFYMTQPTGNTIYKLDCSLRSTYSANDPEIVLNGNRVVSVFSDTFNMKAIDTALLRPAKVRNQFYVYNNYPSSMYAYIIGLTND